ncbi:MAG: hypothetical protein JF599_07830 [Verrucomicrobia bacterium]|nr:hypothetical protein [Verrucomicrobiota bacterium]
MNLSEEAPKLPKLPFLVGDGVLIATAFFIARQCASPIGPWPLLAITVCVVLGAGLAIIPFLADYARRQDAELTERQNQIAALARTTSESAEQLSIAAASLHGIAEASSGNLKLVEELPRQLQESVKNLQKQLAETTRHSAGPAKEEHDRTEATANRLAQTAADLTRLETATRQHLAALNEAFAKLPGHIEQATAKASETLTAAATSAMAIAKAQALADIELHLSAAFTRATAPDEPLSKEAPRRKRTKPPSDEIPVTEETLAAETPAPVSSETPASEPAPRVEPPLAPVDEAPLSIPADPSPDEVPVAEPPPPARTRQPKPVDEESGFDLGLSIDEPEGETSVSSDGFTRLIATAYIGIGNKLFIRGEGPGLSWEKGVPLQFVSIGKWRWETPDATTPVKAKLYKNDQTECTALGLVTLDPGHQHEVNAGF